MISQKVWMCCAEASLCKFSTLQQHPLNLPRSFITALVCVYVCVCVCVCVCDYDFWFEMDVPYEC